MAVLTERLGADYLSNYQAFISVGHDEYWSQEMRDALRVILVSWSKYRVQEKRLII